MTSLSIAQVLDGADLGVNFGVADLTFATINGRSVIYAYARIDERLIEIEVDSTGLLTVVGGIDLTGDVQIGREPELHVLESATSLIIAGYDPDSGSVSLSAGGTLGGQQSLLGAEALEALSSFAHGSDFLTFSSCSGGGLDLFQETGAGLTLLSTISDATETYLAGVSDTLVLQTGGTTRVIAASSDENGLTLLDVAADRAISVLGTLGAQDGLAVSGSLQVAELGVKGGTFVAVAAAGSSSLSLVEVEANGAMRLTDHVLDSEASRFQGVSDIAATRVGDFAYLVTGGSDGGVSLFTALPGGQLVHLATIEDTSLTTLSRIGGLEMSVAAGALQIFGSSPWEAGLTRLTYDVSMLGAVLIASPLDSTISGTSLDDQLVGSAVGEMIDGGAGDDILYDGAGSDTLKGSGGADLFIFEADGVADTIQDFEVGVDRLDLSSFDFLYDVDQLEITSTSTGAILSFRGEEITLTSADQTPLEAGDFTTEDVLNVDRPPQLMMARQLSGGPLADLLNGADGFDTISGGDGNDTIFGNGGDDFLVGQGALDHIDGGGGADTIDGGTGADTLTGGEGDDKIDGGAGNDLIYGDASDWVDAL